MVRYNKMAAPAPPPPPQVPNMPPPMHVIMRNKSRNYDCYKKQNADGSVTYGFVVRRYIAADGVEKAIFVYHKPGTGNQADHIKMAKLEPTERDKCAHIPHQDKLSLYNEGGSRSSRNSRSRHARRSRKCKKRTTRRR